MCKWWGKNRQLWFATKDRLWRGLSGVIAGGLLVLLITTYINWSLQWVVRTSPVIVLLIIIAFLGSILGKKQNVGGLDPVPNSLGFGANLTTSGFPIDADHESLGMVYTDTSDSNQEDQSREFWDAVEAFKADQEQDAET